MANQADVYIENYFAEAIHAVRYLWDGTSDLKVTIASQDTEKVPLQGTDVYLIINAPSGMDIKYGNLTVRTDIELVVSCSRIDSHWKIHLVPNDLAPEAPITVYITVGADAP